MKTQNTLLNIFTLCILLFTGSILNAQSLWSAVFNGGANGGGTLVQMNPDGSGFTKVYDFVEATGSSPMGNVLQATNGKVYGTCLNGGCDSSCVIYCYDPTTNTYTDLWNFDIVSGDFPTSGVVQAPNGLLYGASSAGGAAYAGVIYSFDPVANVYTDLYELTGTSGYCPSGAPILEPNGNLYGLTSGYEFYNGTTSGFGNIYSYNIYSGIYTDLHDFSGVKDGYAFGSLIEHNGIFYGMTSGIPQFSPDLMESIFGFINAPIPAVNNGNIFSFDPATNTYTDLFDFNSTDGAAPYGSLFWANNGKLYGMTSAGGANNLGVIFSLDVQAVNLGGGNVYTKLFDFDGTHGATPMGDLTQSSDGNLYGVTSAGGAYSYGVVFRFDPVANTCTVLDNFDNSTNGSSPQSGAFSVVNPKATGIIEPANNESLSVYPVPAHNNVTVSIQATSGQNTFFTLTDVNGKTIWGPQAEPVDGNTQIQLDLSYLESGVYFLRVSTGDNVTTKKFVRE